MSEALLVLSIVVIIYLLLRQSSAKRREEKSDEALQQLERHDAQAAQLVKLRYFAGFSNAEAASCLGISPRKANQVWAYARAWLREELGDNER